MTAMNKAEALRYLQDAQRLLGAARIRREAAEQALKRARQLEQQAEDVQAEAQKVLDEAGG